MSVDMGHVVGLVLHFRTPGRTLRCLHSLVAEGVRTIVLVDNSEDESMSLACMCDGLESLRSQGECVEVLAPERNLGFAKGVNAGLVRAAGLGAEAILLINSDARLESGALVHLLRGVNCAGACIPRARPKQGLPAHGSFGYYQSATALLTRTARFGFSQYPSGCCLLLRSDLARAPLFDEDFFFYGEDVMLGRDLLVRGVRVMECPDAVIIHEGCGSAKNGSMFYEYHINRGHWLLARKLSSNAFQRAVYIAFRCVTLPLRALVRCVRFRSLTPLRGLLTATVDVMEGRSQSFTPPAK